MSVRSKRVGGREAGQPDSGPTPLPPSCRHGNPPTAIGRARGSKALAGPHPGLLAGVWGGDSLGLIGRFTSPLIGRDLRAGAEHGGGNRAERAGSHAGFKMAPAASGDVAGSARARPALPETQGARVGSARSPRRPR